MYYDYFGLNQPPFRITPDTSLFFPGGDRGAILNAMIYAITSGEGIVKVVGEVGSGKTMLCRMLAVELPANVEVVYLANPNLSPDDILRAIAFELKLAVSALDDRLRVMQSLQQYLLKRHAENRQVVVFVEEAQGMPLTTLEEIRILSNLETRQHKLLQIVLFGQPELDQMIAKREIRQLKERITYSFYLKPLKNAEIRDYLNTRLRACGYRGGEVFSMAAIREIGRYSKGLLRRINILADKALLAAYAANQHKVAAKQVRVAARDSEFVATWQHAYRFVIASGLLSILLIGLWLLPYQHFLQDSTLQTEGNQDTAESETVNNASSPLATAPASDAGQNNPGSTEKSTIYLQQHEPGPDFRDTNSAVIPMTDNYSQLAESIDADDVAESETQSGITPLTTPAYVAVSEQDLANSLQQQDYTQFIQPEDTLLSGEELDMLLQQLKEVPPETANFMETATQCRLCISIIYRPLTKSKNL